VPPFAWPNGARGAVSLTFDDARSSQVAEGIPLFNSRGVKATFYASPAGLHMRLDEWKAATKDGHEIGNHTIHHPCTGNFNWSNGVKALENYTLPRMEDELRQAGAIIRDAVGVEPETFAYPCGQTHIGRGEQVTTYIPVVARLFRAGRLFRSEHVNVPGYWNLAALGGIDSDQFTFGQYREWAERAAMAGGWVVFAGHDIGNGGHQVSIARELDRFCTWLKEPGTGLFVDTVAGVSKWVTSQSSAE
jgi:peptidoglycan/xylan/chitin deacetylase (PgdA/CDA1 family)